MSAYITPVSGSLSVPTWLFTLIVAIGLACTGTLALGASVLPVWSTIILGVLSMVISGLTGFSTKVEK